MNKLASQYKKFMKDLEDNIKNPDDYNTIKAQVTKLFMTFFNEVEEMREENEKKLDILLERQISFNDRMSRIEKMLNNIQKDIYSDEMSDFEVSCPYCGKEFVMQMEELKDEVECPECKNIIELDWNGDVSDCSTGGCSGCSGKCNYDEDEDM